MGYVYRYTDLTDNVIKYVGIVWKDNRTLDDRIYEHSYFDGWCIGREGYAPEEPNYIDMSVFSVAS